MYGSYHEISIVRADGTRAAGATEPTVVAGPLCESGDVFTQEEGGVVVPRELPTASVGDFVVLHDAGAYGASQASNYNTRPLAPELLLENGAVRAIRRRQTVDGAARPRRRLSPARAHARVRSSSNALSIARPSFSRSGTSAGSAFSPT